MFLLFKQFKSASTNHFSQQASHTCLQTIYPEFKRSASSNTNWAIKVIQKVLTLFLPKKLRRNVKFAIERCLIVNF
jgi:hypothetical protein